MTIPYSLTYWHLNKNELTGLVFVIKQTSPIVTYGVF